MIQFAIDPSVNNIGLALYDTNSYILKTHLYHPPRDFAGVTESQITVCIGNAVLRFILIEFLQGKKVDQLVIEYPQWQGSAKGLIAMQKGYTLDLAYLAGVLATGFHVPSRQIWTPTPMQWKGNMPKEATEHRVKKRFGMLQISEHEFDACGLLMWMQENQSGT